MTPPLWLTKARPSLRARALWAALFALVALVFRVAAPSPPPRTADGVAAMLGAAVGGEVRADDFIWEARGGFWSDAFLGRSVLFLARPHGAGTADLYRARVRLTRTGQPLGLGVVRNLTRSPLGDDRDLVATGHHAAYVTWAFGAAQGITLLDLAGDGEARKARGLEAIAGAVSRWLATGSTRGIGRTEVVFGNPPAEAHEELQGDALVMALGKEALPAALDAADSSLNTGPNNPFAAAAQRISPRVPPIDDVAVEAAREVIGPTAASVLRASLDALARAARRLHPPRRAPVSLPPRDEGAAPAPPPGEDGWPLPAITPPIQPALAGEGAWVAGPEGGPRSETAAAPPCFFETALRPDPGHPDAVVRLWAMDTRQIDLQLVAGVDEPRSEVGLHGAGRLPEGTPADRVVAAFTAGPAAPSPRVEPGFVADRRVLVPPGPGLATLAITSDGRVEMGAWAGEATAAFTSIRQTPDAILGWADPARRPLEKAGEAVERSALGMTRGGQLVYAWAAQAPAATLARALSLAGCTFAVPLAAAPARVGLAYAPPAGGPPPEPSPNDVLYAVRRAAGPPPLASGSFAPDGGKQPAPAWLPAIHAASVTSLGAQVHLTAFAPGRLAFRILPGTKEPSTKGMAALTTSLPEGEAGRVVATIGLASGRRKGARGLVVDGAVGLPIRSDDAGALVVERGRPRIVRASEVPAGAPVDATELPLTADEGKLRPEARDVGTMRTRAAACALDDGTLVVASTTFDSDEATTAALLDLGCARVVALDRGSHQAAFVHRAGTATAPEARYEASALYAVEVPLPGRAGPLAP